MAQTTITERAEKLLQAIVARYIDAGQPVASKALACSGTINLSAASVRNIMAELEQAGFLHSPHTSAGRVPTVAAYRFFVNRLLTTKPPASLEIDQIDQTLNQELKADNKPHNIIASVSTMLSGLTQLAGVVTVPRCDKLTCTQIEFVPLAEHRVLVILVVNDKEVHNQIVVTQREYSGAELKTMAAELNQIFTGQDLATIQAEISQRLQQDWQTMTQMVQAVLEVADKTLAERQTDGCVVSGKTNLLQLAEEVGLEGLQGLLSAFRHKQALLHLLDRCLEADGVQIFIGDESGFALFEDCSVITAPYSIEHKPVGVLGVIGPKRMNYQQVISTVDVTAKLLSAALSTS